MPNIDPLQRINNRAEEIFDILDLQRDSIRKYLRQVEKELNLETDSLVLDSSLDTEVSYWKSSSDHHYIQLADFPTHIDFIEHLQQLNSN